MNRNRTTSFDDRATGRRAAVLGAVLLATAFGFSLTIKDGTRQFLFAYLANFAFVLSISLGALVFVLIHHVTSAGWSVVVRRTAEVLAANVATCAVLAIPVLLAAALGRGVLYEWTNPAYLAVHEEIAHRLFYPNLTGFLVRLAICFGAWVVIARYFLRKSVEQDHTGDVEISNALRRYSAPALVVTGFAIAFAAFDLMMSLDPVWMSTIFGVYYFAGSMVGFFAVIILLGTLLKRRRALPASVGAEHFHDLGKYLFAFLFFWGYIAFSQYMLIWYGNIPEETAWFLRRGATTATGDATHWTCISVMLLAGHLLIPFAALLSRFGKRRTWLLCFWAAWLLATHWLDLFWLVVPEYRPEHSAAGLAPSMWALSLLILGGLGGLYVAGAARLARGLNSIPTRDPRLNESLGFQNV